MVELVTVDLVLDIILKLILIGLLVFVFYILRNLDRLVKSFERSAERLEHTAGTVEDMVSIARKIPFVGPKRKRKIDIEEE